VNISGFTALWTLRLINLEIASRGGIEGTSWKTLYSTGQARVRHDAKFAKTNHFGLRNIFRRWLGMNLNTTTFHRDRIIASLLAMTVFSQLPLSLNCSSLHCRSEAIPFNKTFRVFSAFRGLINFYSTIRIASGSEVVISSPYFL